MFKQYKVPNKIRSVVDTIWLVDNRESSEQEVNILPDGFLKLLIFIQDSTVVDVRHTGIFTEPKIINMAANTVGVGISLNVLGPEFFFNRDMKSLINESESISKTFLGIDQLSVSSLDLFIDDVIKKIIRHLELNEPTEGKMKLVKAIYDDKIDRVAVLESYTGISSKQLNRYFNNNLGISTKQYLNLKRLRNSFMEYYNNKVRQTPAGYYDQAHFIKEFKKYVGYTPDKIVDNQDTFHEQFKPQKKQ